MTTIISGTAGVTFPAGGLGNPAGAVVGTTDTQTLTNKTLSTGLVMGVSAITSGTAVASTSGTSIDFTSIPTWVKRITVMFNGVSTNGTSIPQIQIGAGSIDATSYSGSAWLANTNNTAMSTGFLITAVGAATYTYSGIITLAFMGSNIWVMSAVLGHTETASINFSAGSKTLSGTLDRVRITTVNGTDTFDAGSINILYE
ncbi:hypothetical protein UFOVP566_20 [uncultured Caudovirales phage]|uniref:Uncharacterized protein n=1 Tax=uncultured Caudovirales phage TaxID=2100421 RepID=A0A6J5LT77_9CAUD|nr:hypothetical protein UFOVP294_65 [uncultured Caudovirales phage]CAB4150329.1 hypothetical protein UFOVP566_20 [uncultured Caudovirales phage]